MAELPLPPAAAPAAMDWSGLFRLMNLDLGISISTVEKQGQAVSL